MIGIIIGIIVTFAIIGLGLFVGGKVKSQLATFKSTKFDKSEMDNIKNTQDILPFADIALNRIDLGNFKYTVILKVDPYNYMIRSTAGQNSFAIRLRRAMNSIPFKTQMFTHTRKMTTEKMMANLDKTISETLSKYPDQKEYSDQYYQAMSVLNVANPESGALRRVKDHYIGFSWEPGEDHVGMSDSELQLAANNELANNLNIIVSSLNQAGLNVTFLTTEEIIYLLTDIMHRDESNRADLVFDKSYLTTMVSGDRETLGLPDKDNLRSIVEGALDELSAEVISDPSVDTDVRKAGESVYNIFAQVRDKLK